MLPWRTDTSPYRVLVSELMLQQTQVERVVSKFRDFLEAFPTINALAIAPQRDVLKHWQGLGYNRRARFLHKAAQRVVAIGYFPESREELLGLPGVGPYTAGAIRAFAYNAPEVFLETNIRTVLIHHFFAHSKKVDDARLIPILEECMREVHEPRVWYSALMDYGTYLKRSQGNATRKSTTYTKQSPFKGSRRQVRGSILTLLSKYSKLTHAQLLRKHELFDADIVTSVLADLIHEGFITKRLGSYTLV